MPSRAPTFTLVARQHRKSWATPSKASDLRIRGRKAQALRRLHLAGEPLCRECLKQGVTREATIVDHIIPLSQGGTEDAKNKQSLCKRHSDLKTATESAFARRVNRKPL